MQNAVCQLKVKLEKKPVTSSWRPKIRPESETK